MVLVAVVVNLGKIFSGLKLKEKREKMNEIVKLFLESGAKRWDGVWEAFEYKIYWVGSIIRIDLKPKVEKL